MPSSASPLVLAWPFNLFVPGRINSNGKMNGKMRTLWAFTTLASKAACVALVLGCAGAAHGAMAPSWGAAKITLGSNGDSLFPMAGAAESRTADDADAGDVLRAIAANGVAATMAATNAVQSAKDDGHGTAGEGRSPADAASEGKSPEDDERGPDGADLPSGGRGPSDCASPSLSQTENSKQQGTK